MLEYLTKWAVSALIMPLLVIIFGRAINSLLVIFFWPSSLVLMALGSEERPWGNIIYVWSVGIFLNMVLYVLIGYIFYSILKR